MMPQYIDDFLTWLKGFVNYEAVLNKYTSDDKIFSLEPIRKLCAALGHPELAMPTIHVAGSKGKGSVCKMLACVLDQLYPEQEVTLFASPHVFDFRERIGAAKTFFSNAVYRQSIQELQDTVQQKQLADVSWHELTTAFGFLCARNSNSACAVIETGCGGRLDATNVVRPELTIITPIELEHTALLGDTVEKIAREKAGIIKPRTPVVIAPQKFPEVRQVFVDVAARNQAPIYFVDELVKISTPTYYDEHMQVQLDSKMFRRPLDLNLQLLGLCQAENAASTALALKILFPDLDEAILESGLAAAKLPGRFEIRDDLVLDGAHTPKSVQHVMATLAQVFPNQKFNLLFACLAGKDIEHIAPLFRGRFEQAFLTAPGDFREGDLPAMKAAFARNQIAYYADEDYQQVIKMALESRKPDTKLLVVGSFHLLDIVNQALHSKEKV